MGRSAGSAERKRTAPRLFGPTSPEQSAHAVFGGSYCLATTSLAYGSSICTRLTSGVASDGWLLTKPDALAALLRCGRNSFGSQMQPPCRMWSWKFSPTCGACTSTLMLCWRSCASSPMPLSIRSFGVLIPPELRMTSDLAWIRRAPPAWAISTPVARVPSKVTRSTWVRTSSVTFLRASTGYRYERAMLWRRPSRMIWFISAKPPPPSSRAPFRSPRTGNPMLRQAASMAGASGCGSAAGWHHTGPPRPR